MTWAAARDRMKTVLEGVSITTPQSETMRRVYAGIPRESREDYEAPCVVMQGWTRPPRMHPSGLQLTVYTQRFELVIDEHDRDRLVDYIEAWQDAIETAFVADVTLNANASAITLPEWDEVQGDRDLVDRAVVPFSMNITIASGVTYAP